MLLHFNVIHLFEYFCSSTYALKCLKYMYVSLQTVLHGPKDVRSSKQILLTVIRYAFIFFPFEFMICSNLTSCPDWPIRSTLELRSISVTYCLKEKTTYFERPTDVSKILKVRHFHQLCKVTPLLNRRKSPNSASLHGKTMYYVSDSHHQVCNSHETRPYSLSSLDKL